MGPHNTWFDYLPGYATLDLTARDTINANLRAQELIQEQAARVEAEAGLARLGQVVDAMPEGILLGNAEGEVYLSNAAAREIMTTTRYCAKALPPSSIARPI